MLQLYLTNDKAFIAVNLPLIGSVTNSLKGKCVVSRSAYHVTELTSLVAADYTCRQVAPSSYWLLIFLRLDRFNPPLAVHTFNASLSIRFRMDPQTGAEQFFEGAFAFHNGRCCHLHSRFLYTRLVSCPIYALLFIFTFYLKIFIFI